MKQPKKPTTKVERLLRELAPQEREKLIKDLRISRATFYRWCNQPGKIEVTQAQEITTWLGKLQGRAYSMLDLWKAPLHDRIENKKRIAA